jgi:hypothetical protein
VALDLPGITLEKGKVYTAFAVGLLQGQPALKAKLVVDAAAPAAPPASGVGSLDGSSGTATWVWLLAIGAGLAGLVLAGGVLRYAAVRVRR